MIQVNLLPKEEQVAEPRLKLSLPRARFWISIGVAAAILIPVGGLVAVQRARIHTLRADIAQARVEMERLRPQVERIQRLMVERDELNLRLSIIQGISRERYLPVEMMDHLADQVPGYLWLTKVAQTGTDQLTVEGMTFSNLMIAELMMRMEQTDLFKDVSLVVAEKSKQKSDPGRMVLNFTLTARITS